MQTKQWVWRAENCLFKIKLHKVSSRVNKKNQYGRLFQTTDFRTWSTIQTPAIRQPRRNNQQTQGETGTTYTWGENRWEQSRVGLTTSLRWKSSGNKNRNRKLNTGKKQGETHHGEDSHEGAPPGWWPGLDMEPRGPTMMQMCPWQWKLNLNTSWARPPDLPPLTA